MVTARLLWQTPSLRDAAISALTETLGLEGDGGAPAHSTTAKAGTFRDSAVEADKLAPRPLRQGPNKGEPTIDAHIPDATDSVVATALRQVRPAPVYLHPGDMAALCSEPDRPKGE
jgi:hypothetical protein